MTAYLCKLNMHYQLPNELATIQDRLNEYVFYKKDLMIIKAKPRRD